MCAYIHLRESEESIDVDVAVKHVHDEARNTDLKSLIVQQVLLKKQKTDQLRKIFSHEQEKIFTHKLLNILHKYLCNSQFKLNFVQQA